MIVGSWTYSEKSGTPTAASLQNIYVALSRVTSFAGLLLLQPLPDAVRKKRTSKKLSFEMQRLEALHITTQSAVFNNFFSTLLGQKKKNTH